MGAGVHYSFEKSDIDIDIDFQKIQPTFSLCRNPLVHKP